MNAAARLIFNANRRFYASSGSLSNWQYSEEHLSRSRLSYLVPSLRIRIDVMRPRSSSRGRNTTSALVAVTVTVPMLAVSSGLDHPVPFCVP